MSAWSKASGSLRRLRFRTSTGPPVSPCQGTAIRPTTLVRVLGALDQGYLETAIVEPPPAAAVICPVRRYAGFTPWKLAASSRQWAAMLPRLTTGPLPFGSACGAVLEVGPLTLDVTSRFHAPVLLVDPDGRELRFPRCLAEFRDRAGRRGFGWIEWNQPQPAKSRGSGRLQSGR